MIIKEDKPKYNHAEAFHLMNYKCEKCGYIEKLWNSRDGVTPFVIGCSKCNGAAQHVYWGLDVCLPDFIPLAGTRIFVDITREQAETIARRRIESAEGTNFELPADEIEKRIGPIIEHIYHNGEAPHIKVV